MKKVLAIVFSNMHEHTISEVTAHRCMGSIPFGGRYRLIDFALSNLANSGIEKVGVVTKSNYQSLMDHLGTGRAWDLSRKNGGLVILPPFGHAEAGMYRGRIEALANTMGYIRSSGADYVITIDCDVVANIDLRPFVQEHKRSGADISVMYKRVELSEEGIEQNILTIGDDGFVSDIQFSPRIGGKQNVYMNIMIAGREFLEGVVSDNYTRHKLSFDHDIMQVGIHQHRVHAFEFDGYVSRFHSMRSYFQANMNLLDSATREALFPRERPIYTKVRDEAPVRFGLESSVSGSMFGDGCVIEGAVENSVLFRGVRVGKGAVVRNCILMQGTRVMPGSNLDYVITDKDVSIKDNRMIMGYETYPVYIAKGSAV